jgi:hypothetical protein
MQSLDVCRKTSGKIWHRKPTPSSDNGYVISSSFITPSYFMSVVSLYVVFDVIKFVTFLYFPLELLNHIKHIYVYIHFVLLLYIFGRADSELYECEVNLIPWGEASKILRIIFMTTSDWHAIVYFMNHYFDMQIPTCTNIGPRMYAVQILVGHKFHIGHHGEIN